MCFMVRIEMKFVAMSTLMVVLVSVEVMNMLPVMRMASCVKKGMLHRISAGMCASHAYISAPKAWPSSSSHSIAASPLASIVANMHGPCGAVCFETMPVDVDGDADVAGLAGDALLIQVLLLLMMWMMVGRLMVTSACAALPQHEPQHEQTHHLYQYTQTERHQQGHQEHHHHERHPVATECGTGKRQGCSEDV